MMPRLRGPDSGALDRRAIPEVAHLGQDAARAPRDLAPRLRKRGAFGPPLHQADAQLPLQLLDLHGERGLGYGAMFRGLAEVAEAGNRVEVAKLLDGRHRLIRFPYWQAKLMLLDLMYNSH